MAGTIAQWRRTLRRAYDIPDVVSDLVAIDALVQMLAKQYKPDPTSTVNMRSLSTLIVDAVLDCATNGALDHRLLPDRLRGAYVSPTYGAGPVAAVLRSLDGKKDQFSDFEEPPPQVSTDIIEELISKLQVYLANRPLAFTATGDDSWRFRDS